MDAARPERIYHLALAADWAEAQASGQYTTSTRGRSLDDEGFVHCSFAHQVAATADRYYADADDLVLLHVDPSRLHSRVVVEDLTSSGEPFPHVYGPIDVLAVVDITALGRGTDGRWAIAVDERA